MRAEPMALQKMIIKHSLFIRAIGSIDKVALDSNPRCCGCNLGVCFHQVFEAIIKFLLVVTSYSINF